MHAALAALPGVGFGLGGGGGFQLVLRGEGARAHLVSHGAPCTRLGRRLADPGMGPCLACRSWLSIRSGDLHVDMAVAAGGSHGAPGVLADVRMCVCVYAQTAMLLLLLLPQPQQRVRDAAWRSADGGSAGHPGT